MHRKFVDAKVAVVVYINGIKNPHQVLRRDALNVELRDALDELLRVNLIVIVRVKELVHLRS